VDGKIKIEKVLITEGAEDEVVNFNAVKIKIKLVGLFD
jgi:hypothetical protein